MVSSWELRNSCSPNYSSKELTPEYSMSINMSVLLSMGKCPMVNMSWAMPDIKPASTSKTTMYSLVEEPSQTDYHYTWMLILYIMKWDLSVPARFLHHGTKMKDMDYICLSHQEHISAIAAAQLAKEDKQQKLNSKKQTLVNWHVEKLYSMLQRCKYIYLR